MTASVNTLGEARPANPGQFVAPRELPPTDFSRRAPLIGLIGVLIAFVSIATLFALQQPPFVGADEKAHLAYAHVVADGSLPTIDERQPVPMWADQWMSEVIYTQLDQNRTVWVANHPPLFYASVAPLIWFSDITHPADGGLLMLRLANIAYGAVGILFTYAIAKELTQSARLALLSAAAAAMVTQLHAALSLGMSDGLTYAAGAAVTWAGLRCLRRGTTRSNLALLAGTTAVAAGARAVTMLVAFSVVFVVAAFELRTPRLASRERWRSALRVCVIGVAPAVLLFGWFYIRNIVLYGDIGASSYLLERFYREPNGSLIAQVFDADLWRALWFRSMSPFTYRGPRPPWMLLTAAVAVGGLVVAVVTRRTGDHDAEEQHLPIARRSVFLLLAGMAVIVWFIAEHVSGGGYLHPRYLFPVLGSVMTLFVIGLDRVLPRILPTAIVVGMGIWTVSQIPVDIDVSWHSRPRDGERLAPLVLRSLPGNDFWRDVAGIGIIVGSLIAGIVLVMMLVSKPDARSDRDPRGTDELADAHRA